MTEQLKPYFSNYFQCDNCQKEFHRDMVYSPDSSLKKTYCANCVKTEGKKFCSFQKTKIAKKSVSVLSLIKKSNYVGNIITNSEKSLTKSKSKV